MEEGQLQESDALERFRRCLPLFQALGEAVRQDIIFALAEHETLTVNRIAEYSHLSRPAISHHLRVLREAGLVAMEQKGKEHWYTLTLDQALEDMKRLIRSAEGECIVHEP